jgi:transposase-like protein
MKENSIENRTICKYCGSSAVTKYGRYKDVQRYRCKACLRKFKGDTAGFHMKIPAEYIDRALNMYYAVISVSSIQETIKKEGNIKISRSMIYRWIKRYTDATDSYFKSFKPQVSGTWIVKERSLELDALKKVNVWDVLDAGTRFLLASRALPGNDSGDLETVLQEAVERSGKTPEEVILDTENPQIIDAPDLLPAHSRGLPVIRINNPEIPALLKDRHNTISAILIAPEYNNTPELLTRFEAVIDQINIPRPFRTLASFAGFIKGWSVYYNYFKPHNFLAGKTPAEQARINYSVKNWISNQSARNSGQV